MSLDITTRVLLGLVAHGVRFRVFGAVALNLHGIARATEDLDIFVEPDAANIERLKLALLEVFGDPSIADIDATELIGDYPAVQYVPPEGEFHMDILTRLGEAFTYADLDAVEIDVMGTPVPVVSLETLYEMKKGTVRYKDRIDAERIRERLGR